MNLLHELSEPAKKLIDYVSFSLAGVAAFSLANAALYMTFAAGAASFVLACLRIHDRIKYGPTNKAD